MEMYIGFKILEKGLTNPSFLKKTHYPYDRVEK